MAVGRPSRSGPGPPCTQSEPNPTESFCCKSKACAPSWQRPATRLAASACLAAAPALWSGGGVVGGVGGIFGLQRFQPVRSSSGLRSSPSCFRYTTCTCAVKQQPELLRWQAGTKPSAHCRSRHSSAPAVSAIRYPTPYSDVRAIHVLVLVYAARNSLGGLAWLATSLSHIDYCI